MPDGSTLAERIRRYALDQYVGPARQAQKRTVAIRAGDVHRELGLTSRVPAVCSALESVLFERLAGVIMMERTGPIQSTTTQFRYRLEAHSEDVVAHHVPVATQPPPRSRKSQDMATSRSDSTGAVTLDTAGGRRLFLVSCVKTKLSRPAKAKDLYISDWFRKARACVEREGGAWRILSAKYGLVHPEDVIQPYEKTLITMQVTERRTWADNVLKALEHCLGDADAVVFFAGERYREFLEPWLRSRCIGFDVPMRGLSQGRQLAYLGARLREGVALDAENDDVLG